MAEPAVIHPPSSLGEAVNAFSPSRRRARP
jgi:hypothetical protein